MFEKLAHHLTGYVKIEISGADKSRFLNMAIRNKIQFWNYRKEDDNYVMCLRIKDYRKLKDLKKRYKVKIKLKKKRGLPFHINKLNGRWGLLIGGIFAICFYIYLSSCYWVIDVKGESIYTHEEILEVANDYGIYTGVARSSVDEDIIMLQMLTDFPELSWLTINTYGSNIEIVVQAATAIPEIFEQDGLADVVATESGRIVSIIAQKGVPVVSVGDFVNTGDILISGTWDSNRGKEEWLLEDEPIIFTALATGEVMAEVTRIYTVEIEKVQEEYEITNTYSRFKIGFFSLEFPLTFSLAPSGDYSYYSDTDYFYLLGTKLPIYLEKETLTKLDQNEYLLSEEYAQNEIYEMLMKEMENIGEGNSVSSISDIEYYEDENYYYGEMHCKCIVNIAIQLKSAVN